MAYVPVPKDLSKIKTKLMVRPLNALSVVHSRKNAFLMLRFLMLKNFLWINTMKS